MKRNIVFTIARQYGSGGRTMAQMLSEDLGINYYDRDLIKMASEESGISEALFLKADESVSSKNPLIVKLSKSVYNGKMIPPDSDDFVSMENLFNYQAAVIKRLAETESCVIVGRAADYVLKDYENAVRVFVHAPRDFLVEQAEKKISLRGKELDKFMEKTDKQKADYYTYYTGKRWSEALNYDLCLDSSKLGFEKCMEAIKAYTRVRFGDDIFD